MCYLSYWDANLLLAVVRTIHFCHGCASWQLSKPKKEPKIKPAAEPIRIRGNNYPKLFHHTACHHERHNSRKCHKWYGVKPYQLNVNEKIMVLENCKSKKCCQLGLKITKNCRQDFLNKKKKVQLWKQTRLNWKCELRTKRGKRKKKVKTVNLKIHNSSSTK